MTISTVQEAIDDLNRMYGNALETSLVITWWDQTDFEEMKDLDDAMQICEDALEVCVGHINDTVWSNAKMKNDQEEEEE
jgi:hypothetical protein